MLRSFPASSSGEGSRSCPSSHTAPAASHALQASKGCAERHGGDSKRHGQKPRLKRDVSRAESLQIHPDRAASCFWLLVGGRDLAPLITQTEKPSLHHHHTVSGESRSLTESEPCRLCRAARALPRPGDSAGDSAPKVEDSPGTNWENWISISHPVLCCSRVIPPGSLHHHPSSTGHGQRLPSPTSDWLHRGIETRQGFTRREGVSRIHHVLGPNPRSAVP